MSYVIESSAYFDSEAKRLGKRYRSFHDDLVDFINSLQENPLQGIELSPGIRKIRMPITSKGRGKAGSARVITGNAIVAQGEGRIAFLLIYDKADASSVKMNVVKAIAREMGF